MRVPKKKCKFLKTPGYDCMYSKSITCDHCQEEDPIFEKNFNKLMNIIDEEVTYEFFHALENHPPYPTYHHGFAVIKEELDELWEEVRKKNWDKAAMRKEVIHVVTTGLRFYFDLLCDDEDMRSTDDTD
jgi:acetyl/propionyl-CoA carboxylase alpha subunit